MLETTAHIELRCDPLLAVYSTLLSLVHSLQDATDSEDELVETAAELVNSGRVVLTGNFKGCRLEPARTH